jgi:hypothetical protein
MDQLDETSDEGGDRSGAGEEVVQVQEQIAVEPGLECEVTALRVHVIEKARRHDHTLRLRRSACYGHQQSSKQSRRRGSLSEVTGRGGGTGRVHLF